MTGRSLKHYEKYKEKLLKYASGLELRVEFKEEFSEGIYLPSKRLIRVDTELDESTEIAVLLHELGHAIDDAMTEEALLGPIGKAYSALYKGKPTTKQVTLVLKCEANAWELGKMIAKQLRIPLGKWYDYEITTSLDAYAEHSKK